MRARAGLAAALVALVGAAGPLQSQAYFGQNQVQYDSFDWQVLETEHFRIHYYPQERVAVMDAARMVERGYARLSRLMNHEFREKKPLILFASRSDFGQNNVLGDLGEGTGGVTEALRHRILLPFTGDYASFEHVLQHELVHAFYYDIIARGKAGRGLQTLSQVAAPLWFTEGMAEYLSLGSGYTVTNTVMRDAALNGRIPTIEQMTERPDRYNPYEFGEALWAYIGERWGDHVIGNIVNAVATLGVEKAFRRETGLTLEELGEEWRDAMRVRHLAAVEYARPARAFSEPLLSKRRTGGEIFLGPALSSDGKQIAFLSTGNFARGEVFIDLWLGDARTGKRKKRLVESTLDPNFEELRLLYSQPSFSPDGRYLALTAQRRGRDMLNIIDVQRRKLVRRFNLPLEGVTNPAWSPDGRRIVLSGNAGGITDLYVVNVDGSGFQRLTNDRHGDLQPAWSPDGRRIAFASDRGAETDFDLLRISKWVISIYDMETGRVDVLPGQGGHNLNPQWAPDGKSLAFVSDRSGTQNLFLFDFENGEHYQLTNVLGGVMSVTEYSPLISWAQGADRLAFTYFGDGEYTVWAIDDPRSLRKQPFRDESLRPAQIARRIAEGSLPRTTVALLQDSLRRVADAAAGTNGADGAGDGAGVAAALPAADSTPMSRSTYRTAAGLRPSAGVPSRDEGRVGEAVSVAALLDSFALALPDTSTFEHRDYKIRYQPDYVAQPSIGYAQDNWGRGVFGGTTVVMSDLLGNHHMAFSGEVNGRVAEARVFAAYTNLTRRLQYMVGGYQFPQYMLQSDRFLPTEEPGVVVEEQGITRYIMRQAFATGIYPLNRFSRWEFGSRFTNLDQSTLYIQRTVDTTRWVAGPFGIDRQDNHPGVNYISPFVAYVSDNVLFGYTGPIMGRRYRFQVEPTVGSLQWVEYLADYRRYDPIIFNFLTVATRFMMSAQVGRDESVFPKYIGRPEFLRGYDRERFLSRSCFGANADPGACSASRLIGSRVAVANAELRFPLVRRFELGVLPIALPPLDGLVFYDAGIAWTGGQELQFARPRGTESLDVRYPLTSYGFGLRLNLFGFAVLRWDYAIPTDRPNRSGFWTWSIGPSF